MRLRAFASILFAISAVAGVAQAQAVSEPAVKAAFLYKFLGYVEWPASVLPPDAPYVIATMGGDDVAGELERIVATRSINGRRVTVRRMREGEPVQGVHVLFVARAEAAAREVLRALQHRPVLTVTDAEHGLDLGGIVNLVTAGDRVGFEVSLDAAEQAGIGISSRMLAVARRVTGRAGGAG